MNIFETTQGLDLMTQMVQSITELSQTAKVMTQEIQELRTAISESNKVNSAIHTKANETLSNSDKTMKDVNHTMTSVSDMNREFMKVLSYENFNQITAGDRQSYYSELMQQSSPPTSIFGSHNSDEFDR